MLAAVRGDNLWKTGFHFSTLSWVQLLSGLARIEDVVWYEAYGILVFIVENKDTTGTLFHKGSLAAVRIADYLPKKQSLLVQGPGIAGFCGGVTCVVN